MVNLQSRASFNLRFAGFALLSLLLAQQHSPSSATKYRSLHPSQPDHLVTLIESQASYPSSLLAFTSDQNYALLCPKLTAKGWTSISVNGDQIFVLKDDNTTFSGVKSKLSADDLDIISEARAASLHNLVGLELGRSYRTPEGSQSEPTYQDSIPSGLIKCPKAPNDAGYKSRLSYWRPRASINYHNLQGSPVNQTLDGDVYQFDLSGNILQVYSSSVSIYQDETASALYRDQSYFSYSRPCMPQQINRIILHGNSVVFVYNDATMLVKSSYMLDTVELDLVVNARQQIKEYRQKKEPFRIAMVLEQSQESERAFAG